MKIDSPLWKKLKKQAFDGSVDVKDLPADEYKYFSELMKLYEKYRRKELDEQQAKRLEAKIYMECLQYRRAFEEAQRIRKTASSDLLRIEGLLCRIECIKFNTVEDYFKAAESAFEVIGILINDRTLQDRVKKRIEPIEKEIIEREKSNAKI